MKQDQRHNPRLIQLITRYLVISGVLVHVLGIGIYLHFASTGATLYRYVNKGVEFLDRDNSPTRHVARFTRVLLLDSGLVADPIDRFPPNIEFELPTWKGSGASRLRRDTASRYATDGSPIASTSQQWPIATPPVLQTRRVDTVDNLRKAIREATPGIEIRLEPGHYTLERPLRLEVAGTPDRPLVLRGDDIGSTVLELSKGAGIEVAAPYWTVSDLIVRGRCSRGPCTSALYQTPIATALTVRNLFVTGFDTVVRSDFQGVLNSFNGLVDGVTTVGASAITLGGRWMRAALREIAVPADFVVLCPALADGPDCDTDRLSEAVRRVSDNGLVLIRRGTYRQASELNRTGIHLLAEPGAHLYATSTGGKGALVVKKDAVIEGLECSHIKVNDGNGCCVRQDSGNVTLIGVKFHHSQMGILTGHKGGEIRILDSYFHDSGHDESGQLGHNVYVNSGSLEFIRSWSIAARNAGHEIKSRAERTIIRESLIASLNARDSRLIDLPNGGYVEITRSVLGEGPRSENWDLIGYGLESRNRLPDSAKHTIKVTRNTLYVDRPAGARLLNASKGGDVEFFDNVVIGDVDTTSGNTHFANRAEARVGDYPALPALTF